MERFSGTVSTFGMGEIEEKGHTVALALCVANQDDQLHKGQLEFASSEEEEEDDEAE